MVERCAKAVKGKLFELRHRADTMGFDEIVRAVIETLIEEPASGALLARVEEVARSLNRLRSEDHIKSVALDSLSIHREILRSYLRTALSQPNEEGEPRG